MVEVNSAIAWDVSEGDDVPAEARRILKRLDAVARTRESVIAGTIDGQAEDDILKVGAVAIVCDGGCGAEAGRVGEEVYHGARGCGGSGSCSGSEGDIVGDRGGEGAGAGAGADGGGSGDVLCGAVSLIWGGKWWEVTTYRRGDSAALWASGRRASWGDRGGQVLRGRDGDVLGCGGRADG